MSLSTREVEGLILLGFMESSFIELDLFYHQRVMLLHLYMLSSTSMTLMMPLGIAWPIIGIPDWIRILCTFFRTCYIAVILQFSFISMHMK